MIGSLSSLPTATLLQQRAELRYQWRAVFQGVPASVVNSNRTLRHDREAMKWAMRRIDKEIRLREEAK